MTPAQHYSAKKIARLGLAGTIVTAGVPTIAAAEVIHPAPVEEWYCETTPPLSDKEAQDALTAATEASDAARLEYQRARQTHERAQEAEKQLTLTLAQEETALRNVRLNTEIELSRQQAVNAEAIQQASAEEDAARAAYEALLRDVEDAQRSLETAQNEHAEREAQKDTASQAINDMLVSNDILESPENITPEQIQERIAVLETEVSQLTVLLGDKTQERDRLDAERTAAENSVNQAKNAYRDKTHALTQALSARDAQKKAVETALATTNALRDALTTFEKEEGPGSDSYHLAQQKLAQAEAEIRAQEQRSAELEAEIKNLTAEVAQASDTIEQLQGTVAQNNAAQDALNKQIDALNLAITDAQSAIDAKQSELTRLNDQLRALNPAGTEDQPAGDTFTRDELLHSRQDKTNARLENDNSSENQVGVYTSFRSLVEALRANTADVRLGADVYADDLVIDPAEESYVSHAYAGHFNGQNFRIVGLTKPLFSALQGATIENLVLADTKVQSTAARTAGLAQISRNATVNNVHVMGSLQGRGDLAGVIAYANGTTITNVTMKGDLRNTYSGGVSHTGGIVGHLEAGTLSQTGFQGKISTAHGNDNKNRVGGVIGYMESNSRAERVYAGGTILNGNGTGQVGGLVGSTWSNRGHGKIDKALIAMYVDGGQTVHGDSGWRATISNSAIWDGESGPGTDRAEYGQILGTQQARTFYRDVIALSRDVRGDSQSDSGGAPGTKRILAAENYAKLLPFASNEIVTRAVKMLADTDPLVTKRLVSVVPTVDGRMTADAIRDKDRINGLILYYDDRTVERRVLVVDNRQPVADEPAHYYMNGGLPYTPDQRYVVDSGTSAAIANDLRAIAWTSIILDPSAHNHDEQRGRLFLKESFEAQRATLDKQINDLLARESALNPATFDLAAVESRIRGNSQAFLLGLAYVNRWWNIDFEGINLRDVFLFRRDFYGSQESPIDLLIKLGADRSLLTPSANLQTYAALNMHDTGRRQVWQALDDLRRQFTRYDSFDDWFKATTKAYIVESPSLQAPERNVSLTNRLIEMGDLRNALLPMLTVPDDTIFVTVDMANVTFGSFERYMDRKKSPAEEAARVRARIDDYAKRYRDYYDMWYRIGNDVMKRNLQRTIVTWDSLMNPDKSQAAPWGDTWRSVNTFYGPIGRWFRDNNSYAYASGTMTWMVDSGILEPGRFGPATFIHEQTHNMDGGVMLGGYGRRHGARMEVYAKSFLENPFATDHDVVSFNQVDHFEDNPKRYYMHNLRPDRFQTATDLHQYFKGWWEALYVLDNAEAEAMLAQSDSDKAKLFMELGNVPYENRRHLNSYKALTADQIAQMNLTTIQDLVEHELMVRRRYRPRDTMPENGYYDAHIMDPLYGTAESHLGITGETAFKRNAYELLGALGFEEGWVPYVSNKLYAQARAAGQNTMPDTFVMPKILNSTGFSSLKEYRKDAYRKAKERAQTLLKPITITLDGQQITFSDYNQIALAFREAVQTDLRNGNSNNASASKTYRLKATIFSQLMRQTDEFKTSIFTDGDDSLKPWVAPTPVVDEQPTPPPLRPTPAWQIRSGLFDTAALPTPALDPAIVAQQEDLQRRIAAFDTDISALNARKLELDTQLTVADGRKATVTAALQRLALELQTEQTRYEERLARLEVLRGTLLSVTQNKADAEDLKRRNTERIRLVDAEVIVKRTELELAKAQKDKEEARLANAQATVDEAQRDEEAGAQRLSSVQAELTAAEEGYRQLEATRSAISKQLDVQTARRNRLHELERLAQEAEAARLSVLAAAGRLREAQMAYDEAHRLTGVAKASLDAAVTHHSAARLSAQSLLGQTVDTLLSNSTPAQEYAPLLSLIERLRADSVALAKIRTSVNAAHKQSATDEASMLRAKEHFATVEGERALKEAALVRIRALIEVGGRDKRQITCVDKRPLVFETPVYDLKTLAVEVAQPTTEELSSAHSRVESAQRQRTTPLAQTGSDALILTTSALAAAVVGGTMIRRRRRN